MFNRGFIYDKLKWQNKKMKRLRYIADVNCKCKNCDNKNKLKSLINKCRCKNNCSI